MKRIIPVILILICSTVMAAPWDLEALRDRSRFFSNDAVRAGIKPTHEDTEYNYWINAVQQEIYDYTWCNVNVETHTLVPGTTLYAVSDDLMSTIFRVKAGTMTLKKNTYKQLETKPDYENKTAAFPEAYYVETGTFTNIRIIPPPNTDVLLKIEYLDPPDDMTSDSDYPFNNVKRLYVYHSLIVVRVAAIFNFQRGYLTKYESLMKDYNRRIKEMEITIRMNTDEPQDENSPYEKPVPK